MHKKTMLSFRKDKECPTSEELLAFQKGEAAKNSIRTIYDHILGCDFCGAESQFYSNFPTEGEETVRVEEIPTHLFELAEAILKNKNEGGRLLSQLIKENASI